MRMVTISDGYFCDTCGNETETTEPYYICPGCQMEFARSESRDGDSNHCPECNKFSTWQGQACAECGQQIDEEKDKIYSCNICNNFQTDVAEEMEEHLCDDHDKCGWEEEADETKR